jgi:hypothetical protein
VQTRDHLHRLIDELPDADLPEVERYLARRGTDDPVLRALANAPEGDEPLTPEEEAAIREGMEAIERGDVLSQAEVRRELGL